MRPAFSKLRLLGCGAVVLLSTGPPALGQTAPGEPNETRDSATGVGIDQTVSGRLDTLVDIDWYRFDTPDALDIIRVRVTKTNRACVVWATLVSSSGLEVSTTVVGTHRSEVVSAVAAEKGPFFVRLDHGPYDRCGGAAYRLRVLKPIRIGLVPPGSLAPGLVSASDTLCSAAEARKNQLLVSNQWVHHHWKPSRAPYHRKLHRLLASVRAYLRKNCPGWSFGPNPP
jgi:hypothetical protein